MTRNKAKSAALTVTLMRGATVISKVLGLIRNTLLASHYGTTEAANAFSAALRIPLSFFDLLFSAAIVACFVPVYNGFASEESEDAARVAAQLGIPFTVRDFSADFRAHVIDYFIHRYVR